MDVTQVRSKTWPRKEKTNDGRETGRQASQSLRAGKQEVRKKNVRLQGVMETEEFITREQLEGKPV